MEGRSSRAGSCTSKASMPQTASFILLSSLPEKDPLPPIAPKLLCKFTLFYWPANNSLLNYHVPLATMLICYWTCSSSHIENKTTVSSALELMLTYLWSVIWKQEICLGLPFCNTETWEHEKLALNTNKSFRFLAFISEIPIYQLLQESIMFSFRKRQEQISHSLPHSQCWYTYILYGWQYWFYFCFIERKTFRLLLPHI